MMDSRVHVFLSSVDKRVKVTSFRATETSDNDITTPASHGHGMVPNMLLSWPRGVKAVRYLLVWALGFPGVLIVVWSLMSHHWAAKPPLGRSSQDAKN